MACWTFCSATSRLSDEIELQGDDRGAGRAVRGHLLQAGDLAQLHFERRGHGGRHHLRDSRRDRRSAPGWSDSRRRAARKPAGTAPRPDPTSTSAIISSEVATGLRMNRREMFIGGRVRRLRRSLRRAGRCAGACGAPARTLGAPAPRPRRWRLRRRRCLILAPSLSRSMPSVTTMLPAARPDRMTVFLPSLGPKRDLVHGNRVVGVDQIDIVARRTAQHRRRSAPARRFAACRPAA